MFFFTFFQVYRLRLRRQAPEEQTYQLEISFPTKDTEEATNSKGRTERIERLIQDIILAQRNPEKLPNVILNKPSLAIESEFTCPEGKISKKHIGRNHVHLTVRLGFVNRHLWLGNFGKRNRGLRARTLRLRLPSAN